MYTISEENTNLKNLVTSHPNMFKDVFSLVNTTTEPKHILMPVLIAGKIKLGY